MREIFRVLKPGGRLVVIAETYRGGSRDAVVGAAMRLFGSPASASKNIENYSYKPATATSRFLKNGRKAGFALRKSQGCKHRYPSRNRISV